MFPPQCHPVSTSAGWAILIYYCQQLRRLFGDEIVRPVYLNSGSTSLISASVLPNGRKKIQAKDGLQKAATAARSTDLRVQPNGEQWLIATLPSSVDPPNARFCGSLPGLVKSMTSLAIRQNLTQLWQELHDSTMESALD
jgi:hypothetical protein